MAIADIFHLKGPFNFSPFLLSFLSVRTHMHIFLFLFVFLASCAHAKLQIHDLRTGEVISEEMLLDSLLERGTVVLGEYHYTPSLQKSQGQLIEKLVKARKAERNFSVGWEFLDYPEQAQIDTHLEEWKKGNIDNKTFLMKIFKTESSAKRHEVYLPILESVRQLDGQLVATNAPREWKRKVTASGLGSLERQQMPERCEPGSELYLERFKVIMQDHVPTEALMRYFEAQYYTDCVIAQSLATVSQHDLRFLVVGSFHSDYNDAVVLRLNQDWKEDVTSIKMVDGSNLSEEQLTKLIVPHEEYGRIADFLYIIH